MEFSFGDVVLAFVCSFGIAFVLTAFFRRIAIRLSILDLPNQLHKMHSQPIPYLGGASIVVSLLLLGAISTIKFLEVFESEREFLLILMAPLLLSIIGLIDDLKNLSAKSRLLVQIVSSTLVSLTFYSNGLFGAPTGIVLLDFLFTVIWIVGITNAINLFDNLDGGAGGIVVIASLFLAIFSIIGSQFFLGAISVAVAGATLGFLVWNVYPARIYLGDSGALFLGASIAILIIRLEPTNSNSIAAWLIGFAIVAIPILDTTVVVLSRLARGVSPFTGGQDHLSHRLLNKGFTRKGCALILWSLALYFCILGTFLNFVTATYTYLISITLMLSWTLLLVFFLRANPTFPSKP